jgi:hypothetical protein
VPRKSHNVIGPIRVRLFKKNLKLLPLGSYDVILVVDWLASHSPMKVHWLQKYMPFSYGGKKIRLQDILPTVSKCNLL